MLLMPGPSDANLMLSEMLGLPLRLKKSLTDAVQARTLGNPLYIHAFMQSLVKEKFLIDIQNWCH